MRIGVCDLGSNTSLLLVADVAEDGTVVSVRDEATVTRMGQCVFATKRFHADALLRVDSALRRYAAIIVEETCDRVFAVATSAARDVANADELRALGETHGIPIHVIDGRCEAELTYRGATGGLDLENLPTVIDVGGGSTEVIRPSDAGPRGVSVDVGAVRAVERFVTTDPPDSEALRQIRAAAEDGFRSAGVGRTSGDVVAVAGTPTTLATLDQGVAFDVSRVHGYRLTRTRVGEWAEKLGALPLSARAALPGMPTGRADVMPAGALILSAALDVLGAEAIIVSTRGVRFGAAASWREFAP